MNTIPAVSAVGRSKLRLEAPSGRYRLDLWQAQEFASSIALELERIQHGYNPPMHTTRKRTVRISPRRSITVSGDRTEPRIRLEHAPVLQITPEAAHELVAVIVSEIEATEERFEARGIDPYGPL